MRDILLYSLKNKHDLHSCNLTYRGYNYANLALY